MGCQDQGRGCLTGEPQARETARADESPSSPQATCQVAARPAVQAGHYGLPGHFPQRPPDAFQGLLHHGRVLQQEEGPQEPPQAQGLQRRGR